MDNSRTYRDKIEPLPIKDVTAKCIAQLKGVPFARALEGFKVPPDLLADKLIPQANESIFHNLYINEGTMSAYSRSPGLAGSARHGSHRRSPRR